MPVHAGRLLEVAVAVGDLDAASGDFTHLLRAPVSAPVEGPEAFALRFTMCRVGRADFEIMESTRPDGLVARFIARMGEGLHHIAFEIDDAEAAMAELKRLGAPVLGDAPVLTANLKAFFLHPSCFGGILVEFVENLHPWLDGVRYRPTEGAVGIDARRIAGITATVANVDAVAGEFARTIGAGAPHDEPCAWVDGAARTFPIGDIDITLVEAGVGARTGLRYVSVEVDDVEGAASTLETLGADVRRRAADDTSARTALVSWRGLHGVPMELVPAAG